MHCVCPFVEVQREGGVFRTTDRPTAASFESIPYRRRDCVMLRFASYYASSMRSQHAAAAAAAHCVSAYVYYLGTEQCHRF